jgi:hypothetical protein
MRAVVLLTFAMFLGGCQLLTNFVRPLVDDPVDAAVPDGGTEDAGTEDAG